MTIASSRSSGTSLDTPTGGQVAIQEQSKPNRLRWRVYYDSGRTVSDYEFDSLEDVPALGVIAIGMEHPPVGKLMLIGKDYYFWESGAWHNNDLFGLWDYLQRPGWKKVLFGRTIDTERFDEICRVATADTYPIDKSARHPIEFSWMYYPDHSELIRG